MSKLDRGLRSPFTLPPSVIHILHAALYRSAFPSKCLLFSTPSSQNLLSRWSLPTWPGTGAPLGLAQRLPPVEKQTLSPRREGALQLGAKRPLLWPLPPGRHRTCGALSFSTVAFRGTAARPLRRTFLGHKRTKGPPRFQGEEEVRVVPSLLRQMLRGEMGISLRQGELSHLS